MQIQITRKDPRSQDGFTVESLQLVTDPHNIRFSHAFQNALFFRVFKYPYKELVKIAAEHETGVVKWGKSFIRLAVKSSGVYACFVFRYTVETVERKRTGELKRRSIVEKEKVYTVDASKTEIVQLADPFIKELENVNPKQAAAIFIASYHDYAHPLTLADIAATLTEEQHRKAVKVLQALFAA